jgi:hypothetical protein
MPSTARAVTNTTLRLTLVDVIAFGLTFPRCFLLITAFVPKRGMPPNGDAQSLLAVWLSSFD